MGLLRRARQTWRGWPPFWRRVIVGVALAVAIEAYFLWRPHSGLAEALEQTSLDWVMRMLSGTTPLTGRPVVPMTVIDIDERTYAGWKEPLVVPRGELLRLIQFAEGVAPPDPARAALAIVVDMDLSRPADNGGDERLGAYLASRGSSPERSVVPIVLVRTFTPGASPNELLTPKSTILDDRLPSEHTEQRAQGLFWAAPLFERDDDFLVRRWFLWQPTCGEARATVVPSVQLLVFAFGRKTERTSKTATDKLWEHLDRLGRLKCTPGVAVPSGRLVLQVGSTRLTVDGGDLERRIVYTIPWKPPRGYARPAISVGTRSTPLLLEIPAHTVIDSPSRFSAEAVRDRVVIIGGSYAEGRDIHGTPIGPMPGTFVLANAVHSLLQYGELRHPGWFVKLPLIAGLAVAVVLLYAWLGPLWGMIASLGLIVGGLLPLSFWLFRAGVWLEFAVPLLGVMIHHFYEDIREARQGRGQKGTHR